MLLLLKTVMKLQHVLSILIVTIPYKQDSISDSAKWVACLPKILFKKFSFFF